MYMSTNVNASRIKQYPIRDSVRLNLPQHKLISKVS